MTGVALRGASGRIVERWSRLVVSLAAGLLIVSAWSVLLYNRSSTSQEWSGAFSPHTPAAEPPLLLLSFAMWLLMSVAMMLPPVMPWILLFETAGRRRGPRSEPYVPVTAFVGGYFGVWSVYSLGAAVVQVTLPTLAWPDAGLGRRAAGLVLIVAGAFQFSPYKAACLAHCRSPLAFFLSEWRDGPVGAFQMGFRHGLFCLGCCWALMLISLALGMMNLVWMAVLTLVLCVEKMAPKGLEVGRVVGTALVGWGVWFLLRAAG